MVYNKHHCSIIYYFLIHLRYLEEETMLDMLIYFILCTLDSITKNRECLDNSLMSRRLVENDSQAVSIVRVMN